MQKWQQVSHSKALEVMLYIAQRENNLFRIMKYFYLADKKHLSKWGRLLSTDDYRAMKHGPVPSVAYDFVKDIRDDRESEFREQLRLDDNIKVSKKIVVEPLREPNLDYLSKSDIECLDAVIDELKDADWNDLEKLTHDDAYNKANGGMINLLDIVETLPNGNEIAEYLALND